MVKKSIKKSIKKLGLLSFAERMNFFIVRLKNKKSNSKFRKANPNIILPPDFYMYETFALDYDKIYFGGLDTAKWLVNHFEKYSKIRNSSILDWGCGTGRILRHLPSIVCETNVVYGTDYNQKYVDWCSANLDNIKVSKNELGPPLGFKDDFFDFVYGISIFTHLSEEMHNKWMSELSRILKKEGILILTLHGNCFKVKLSKAEQLKFDNGQLIEHQYKKEGNRLFVAYQNPMYFKKLCKLNGLEVLEHIEGEVINTKPQQDVWILQKK